MFRVTLKPELAPFHIIHQQKMVAIGSCFAENIGQRLVDCAFQTLVNPFGIVYNPLSIAAQLELLLASDFELGENDIFYHNELYNSFLHHSNFSNVNKNEMLLNINNQLREAVAHFQKMDILLITLGTAQVHFHNNQAVANCHKLPKSDFETRRISIEETVNALENVFIKIKEKRPNIKIVLSVSPVRYLREGLVNSNRSKAVLLLSIEKLCHDFDFCHYFSAYEYLMDDLRDYRFFADDMLHPNQQAIDYIWQQFSATFFNEKTAQLNDRITKAKTALAHRPLHAETVAYQQFRAKAEADWAAILKEIENI